MDSLTESRVLWSLLLEQGRRPARRHLLMLTEGLAATDPCGWRGSEEIPAVSVHPFLSVCGVLPRWDSPQLCSPQAPDLTVGTKLCP